MNDLNENNEVNFISLFTTPLMEVQLDLDVEKLTELAFEIMNRDKRGKQISNIGGWQSDIILEENQEEFKKLKKEITKHLQLYHSEAFRGMVFKENVTQNISEMWVNVNGKHHYNEWHIHPYSTLSGAYYIKHDGSSEQGNISFKHPAGTYKNIAHWPEGFVENLNEVTAEVVNITPKPNMLLIFPSWLEHKVEINLKDDTRISSSFNSRPILEKTKKMWQGNIWR